MSSAEEAAWRVIERLLLAAIRINACLFSLVRINLLGKVIISRIFHRKSFKGFVTGAALSREEVLQKLQGEYENKYFNSLL